MTGRAALTDDLADRPGWKLTGLQYQSVYYAAACPGERTGAYLISLLEFAPLLC